MTPQQNIFGKSCSFFSDRCYSFEPWISVGIASGIVVDYSEEFRGFEKIVFEFNGKGKLGKIA
jgi:hypothetical protein